MQLKPKVIYVDGGCAGNQQKDISQRRMVTCIYDEDMVTMDGKKFQIRPSIEKGGSNNIAEIMAVFEALRYAIDGGFDDIIIKMDSKVAYFWIKNGIKKKNINDFERTKYVLGRIHKIEKWLENRAGNL